MASIYQACKVNLCYNVPNTHTNVFGYVYKPFQFFLIQIDFFFLFTFLIAEPF
jgi:hypothetical protein